MKNMKTCCCAYNMTCVCMYRGKNGCLRNKQRMKKKGVATVVFLIMSGKDGVGWDGIIKWIFIFIVGKGRGAEGGGEWKGRLEKKKKKKKMKADLWKIKKREFFSSRSRLCCCCCNNIVLREKRERGCNECHFFGICQKKKKKTKPKN